MSLRKAGYLVLILQRWSVVKLGARAADRMFDSVVVGTAAPHQRTQPAHVVAHRVAERLVGDTALQQLFAGLRKNTAGGGVTLDGA